MSPRVLVRLVTALALLAALALVASAAGATPKRPTNRDQALKDGCQRPSFLNLTLVNSPEWVYVNRDPSIHVATGISRVPHPTPIDQPGTHDWFDFNANLVPDKKYGYLIAGSKSAGTNNFGGSDESDFAEAYGRLHYEWEEGSMPKFVWPSDGDRTALWGSWIWDCGHWTEGGKVTGERTELHPLSALAVTRKNSYRARPGEVETDAYISSSGTHAHSTEECARRLKAQPDGTYGTGFFDCVRNHPSSFRQKLAKSYTFNVPAPPRPAGASTLVIRSVTEARKGSFSQSVRRSGNGFSVTVKPKSKTFNWGKEYFVRWAGHAPSATKLTVTLNDLLIKQADPDPSEGGPDPAGEKLALYLEINGFWQLVDDWAPSLFAAHDNMLVHLNKTIPVTLQKGGKLHLFMMGRECDGPSGVTLFGHFVPNTKPCPFNTTESKISEHNNDDPGSILDRYGSVGAALGTHTTKSKPTVFFPGTGPITFNDGIQGNDVYELTYTVKRR